ncbi:MAG: hypothetical protein KVP17_002146 [Porospora cf. gigantea B]|uniref:uncharacterized protein n=1 Tax=Porospora cf. gigantea B TaxID=2853592 RepID=UPI003571E8C2|nr:MAG: hypothetical protein KVP17_002146 [Porospora cf. gigantea B]
MVLFCPSCHNMLVLKEAQNAAMQFSCLTCPYVKELTEKVVRKYQLSQVSAKVEVKDTNS